MIFFEQNFVHPTFQGANPNIYIPRATPWAGRLLAFASRSSATFGSGRYFSKSLPDTNSCKYTQKSERISTFARFFV